MPSKEDVRLSRTMSQALRHAPEQYGLVLAADGSVRIHDLVMALGSSRRHITEEDVRRVVAESDKQRYAITGDRIRAQYGHSTEARIMKAEVTPAGPLWHATSPAAWESIRVEGLRPMARQYVHLTPTENVALEVGRRHAAWPVLLRIEAVRAHADGVRFYEGHDRVTLADTVPPAYIEAVPHDGI